MTSAFKATNLIVKKKRFVYRYVLASIICFIAIEANAVCDFVSARYLTDLSSPESIREINIQVPKSAKYNRNFAQIMVSPTKNIPPSLRKTFRANVTVKYVFGSCKYEAKVKQNGDWKDHIGLNESGQPLRSLNVRLENGNILNAVRFKLLIPKTRGGLNEVLTAVIMKELGFISPETFEVRTNINGTKATLLFQEDAQKELLERNSRREGPLFEGDESLLWIDGRTSQNDSVALSRLTNENWFVKGAQSVALGLKAFGRLQRAYLNRSDNFDMFGRFVQPYTNDPKIFRDYHFISIALQAQHGLGPNNRRFYFNAFINEFEPIYYDGMAKFEKVSQQYLKNLSADRGERSEGVYRFSFPPNYRYQHISRLESREFRDTIGEEFGKRTILTKKSALRIASSKLSEFHYNVLALQSHITENNRFKDYRKYQTTDLSEYNSRVGAVQLDQVQVVEAYLSRDEVGIKLADGSDTNISYEELADLISDMELDGERAVLIPVSETSQQDGVNKIVNDLGWHITGSEKISSYIDEESREITITQSNPKDWILFRDVELDGWKIRFIGKEADETSPVRSQRINEYGMTGCLNLYDIRFSNTALEIDGGACEDSVNIVSSSGFINEITVDKAYADAIDMDFSDMTVESIVVDGVGNDCLDVSGGTYVVTNMSVARCLDKGVSVGEKSHLEIEKLRVEGAALGISSKDLSLAIIDHAQMLAVDLCYEAVQKKQEFGGGSLKFGSIDCKADHVIDSASIVEIASG